MSPRPAALHGVLVGINFYPHSAAGESRPLSTLSCAVNDAEMTFEILQSSRLDAKLLLLANEDATTASIKAAIQNIATNIAESTNGEDSFLFTFSGHGQKSGTACGNQDAVFLTSEYSPETFELGKVGGFTLANVCEWLNGCQPRNIVVLLDSCDSGAGVNSPAARNWPSKNVVVLAATGADAIEEANHGEFSRIALDWWRQSLFSGKPVVDLGEELLQHFLLVCGRQNPSGKPKDAPKLERRGTVALGSHWIPFKPARTLSVDNLYAPVPLAEESLNHHFENEELIRDALLKPVTVSALTNVLIVSDRLVSARYQVRKVASELESQLQKTVLALGANYLQSTLPFLCALGAWRKKLWGEFEWSDEPPQMDFSLNGPTDSLIQYLSRQNAIVIVPHRETSSSEDVAYFLRRCFEDENIRLCLIVHSDEEVPAIFRNRHHSRITLAPVALAIAPQEVDDSRPPPVVVEIRSPRVLSWLDYLGLPDLPEALRYRLNDNPHSILSVLCDLVELVLQRLKDRQSRVGQSRIGDFSLILLRAMSEMRLPRPHSLMSGLFKQLVAWKAVPEDSSVTLSALLQLLTEARLVDRSDSDARHLANHPAGSEGDSVYFLHGIVQRAVTHFIEKNKTPHRIDWQRIVAGAYRIQAESLNQPESLIQNCEIESTWPKAILAHQAISHLEQAEDWPEMAIVLNQFWECLVNSGYQEMTLRWAAKLHHRVAQGRDLDWSNSSQIENAKTDLDHRRELELQLLLNEQRLRRCREEFHGVLDIDGIIRQRQGVNSIYYHESQFTVGDYHLVHGDDLHAMACYQRCRNAEPAQPRLRLRSTLRLVRCLAQMGEYERAEFLMADAEQIALLHYEELSSSNAIVQARLLSAQCDLARMKGDPKELHEAATELWRLSLRPSPRLDESARSYLVLALGRINMAWASLLRGEPARAWNHCLRARKHLNTRGIADHWWLAENERIAALAIGWALLPSIANKSIPWLGRIHCPADRELRRIREQVGSQADYLRQLVENCQPDNPWRLIALESALGQMLLLSNDAPTEGRRLLFKSLEGAKRHPQPIVEGQIHEALAVTSPSSQDRCKHWEAAARLAAGLNLWEQALRLIRNSVRERNDGTIYDFLEGVEPAKVKDVVLDHLLDHLNGRIKSRRREQRYPCNLPVELVVRGKTTTPIVKGRLTSISEHGFFGEFESEIPEGSIAEVRHALRDAALSCELVEARNYFRVAEPGFKYRGSLARPLQLIVEAFGTSESLASLPLNGVAAE